MSVPNIITCYERITLACSLISTQTSAAVGMDSKGLSLDIWNWMVSISDLIVVVG